MEIAADTNCALKSIIQLHSLLRNIKIFLQKTQN